MNIKNNNININKYIFKIILKGLNMETIYISGKDFNAIIHIQKDKIWGYKFYKDNRSEPINESILEYFDFIKLSNNKIKLANEGQYEVYLDNNTNYKHYFLNGKENYELFFENNGDNAILYFSDKKKDSNSLNKTKKFKYKGCLIILNGLAVLSIIIGAFLNKNAKAKNEDIIQYDNEIYAMATESDITLKEIKDMIYASPYLSEDQKAYLYNEDLFNQILPIINEKIEYKYMLLFSIRNIKIEIANIGNNSGHYNPLTPNEIYLNVGEENNKTVLAHEFVHLCQSNLAEFNLLIEGCAEIIIGEFFEETEQLAYIPQVTFVKKLMEVIGSESVWYYNFTGDITPLVDAIKPYLADEELEDFLNCMNYEYGDKALNDQRINRLNKYLEVIYKKKYGKDPKDDPIMVALNYYTTTRYYFNPKFSSNPDYSYYGYSALKDISIDDAIQEGYLTINFIHTLDDGTIEIIPCESFVDYQILIHKANCELEYSSPEGSIVHLDKNYILIREDYKVYLPPFSEKSFDSDLKR
jgi:hypothetical protein